MNRPKNDRLHCLKAMPELKHKIPNEEYDVMKSEVIDWIVKQPEIRQWLFDKVADKNARKSTGDFPLIVYDPDKKVWKGIDHEN